MCPARLSAQGPAGRWSDEEHDILVGLTNKQLELEQKDESKVIPWARHWINVSERLHKKGYNRTSAACLGYWKRTDGTQKANEKAAGPRWEDAEHQILLGMTEEQLELEETDPSAVMSWAKHWKKVSERLKEKGYTRSIDACDAYWNLVQDKSPLVAGTGLDVEDDLSSEEPFQVNCGVEAKEDELEEHVSEPESKTTSRPSPREEPEKSPESPVDVTSPTISEPKRTPRKTVEKGPEPPYNAEAEIMSPIQPNRTPRGRPRKNSRIEKESTSPNQPNRTPRKPEGESEQVVERIKAMIEELGYTPEVNDLPKGYSITKWQYLRWHREQEQQEEEPEEEPEKLQEQQNQPEIQEEPEQPEKVDISNHAFRVSPQPMAQWSSVNSPRPAPVPSKSPSVADEKAPSFKQEGLQQSQFLPEERANVSPAPSGKKQRSTAFRFTPEQRAYLEEKVAKTGSNPDVYSRIEMASELGVEEKTIRNWFINHRQKTNRRSLEDRPRDDFKYANEYSLAPMAIKRTQGSLDGNEIIEVAPRGQEGSPGYGHGHQHKKPRIEEGLRPNVTDQALLVSPPMSEPINIIRKIAPRGPDETTAPAPAPAPPNRGPEIPPQLSGPPTSQPHQNHIWVQDGPPPPPRPGPLSQQHRIIHESPYGVPPHAGQHMNAESSKPYPHTAPRPPAPPPPPPPSHILESQSFQPVNKPPLITDYEPATLSSWNAKPSTSGSSQSQYSNDTKPSSATPQPHENDKDWAARRVPEIQAQISIIKHESDAHMMSVRKLEQQIEEVKNQTNAMQLRKDQEIAHAVREIEKRYERDHEMLRGRQHELGGKREEELELFRRNARLIAKCEKKMQSYLALVDLDNDSDMSN